MIIKTFRIVFIIFVYKKSIFIMNMNHIDINCYPHIGLIDETQNIFYSKVDPLDTNRLQLVSKIKKILNQANSEKDQVIAHFTQVTVNIQQQYQQVIQKLDNFIKLCNEILSEISNIRVILDRNVYQPIQYLLRNEDSFNILNSLSGPKIIISNVPVLFTYIPSLFPHSLYNYSYLIACKTDSDTGLEFLPININPVNIKVPQFCKLLLLDNKKLLITDSDSLEHTLSYIVDIESSKILKLPNIEESRRDHALTWIGQCPAVIAGELGNHLEVTGSVQILYKNLWLPYKSINFPRKMHSAVVNHRGTWIIGGRNRNDFVETIENFMGQEWGVISVRVPQLKTDFGVICLEDQLLIFGGLHSEDEVIALDIEQQSLKKFPIVRWRVSYLQNQCYIGEGKAYYGDLQGITPITFDKLYNN